jgi:hypothetical protein
MPYLWMPSVHSNINYSLPPELGGTVSASPSVGFGDLVSHLNIGFAGAADARYDRFSVHRFPVVQPWRRRRPVPVGQLPQPSGHPDYRHGERQ